MAIQIEDELKCTGCGACYSVCPKNCISMQSDNKGFCYPQIKLEKCIECGLCEKVCPILNKVETKKNNNVPKVYAGWSENIETRYKSTSGGVFSEIARSVLNDGGYVSGAVYDKNCNVKHILTSSEEGLDKIRQSKYTQSDIGKVFIQIREKLLQGNKVLFCGTPCQVAGLKSYLGKDYEELYTVDFICRGVNSPKAYKAWLNELEKKYQSKAIRVWFKYKIHGWKKSPNCTRIDFENGNHCIQSSYKNTYMRGYLGPNLYIRTSCGNCQFKSVNRLSDITLADFWGVAKELDDDKGTSLVLVNTVKGEALFEKIKANIFCEERDAKEIIEGNACFKSSVSINPKSEKFLLELDNIVFSKLLNKYARVPLYKKVGQNVKSALKYILRV